MKTEESFSVRIRVSRESDAELYEMLGRLPKRTRAFRAKQLLCSLLIAQRTPGDAPCSKPGNEVTDSRSKSARRSSAETAGDEEGPEDRVDLLDLTRGDDPDKTVQRPAPGEPVTYQHVAPIFATRCAKCHTNNGQMGPAPEGYRLSSYVSTLSANDRARVVPGNAAASELVRRIRGLFHRLGEQQCAG